MRSKKSAIILSLVVWAILMPRPQASGSNNVFRIDYTVKVASIAEKLFHVTAEVKNINQPQVSLLLPSWTPSLSRTENYAKNVLRFKITDAKGARVPQVMTGPQSWRVETKGLDRIKVEFDYEADVLAVNQAKITNDFALFTGIQLFLMAEGHRSSPSTVRFEVPEGWKVISALTETSDPLTFTAPDYDTLVDSPTEMGKFDVTRFEVEGKPHYFVATPPGAYPKEKTEAYINMLAKTASAQGAIFGGLPYDKYVYFYFFIRPDWQLESTLGFANSQLMFVRAGESPPFRTLGYVAGHEYFHLWNIKRIRPVEFWPYDYSRMGVTPLLWVAEGFTNYYARLARYRAGLDPRQQMFQGFENSITANQNDAARNYTSPADASALAWLDYEKERPFKTSAYLQGEALALALDLSIRRDTAGASSLDDVMRSLYRDFYQRGKGYSTDDLIGVINRLTKRDYRDFFRRHVWGIEAVPYETIIGYAGFQLEKNVTKIPSLGIRVTQSPEGPKIAGIVPHSVGAEAGFAIGDVLITLDELKVQTAMAAVNDWIAPKIGQTIKATVKRAGMEKTLDVKVGSREQTNYKIVEVQNPTPDQLKLREGWLKTNG